MPEVKVYAVRELAGDVLLVEGAVDGRELEAEGWVSALTNHFDPVDYMDDGHRHDDAQPRQLTPEEARAYCEQLLLEAAGPAPAALPIALDERPAPPPAPPPPWELSP